MHVKEQLTEEFKLKWYMYATGLNKQQRGEINCLDAMLRCYWHIPSLLIPDNETGMYHAPGYTAGTTLLQTYISPSVTNSVIRWSEAPAMPKNGLMCSCRLIHSRSLWSSLVRADYGEKLSGSRRASHVIADYCENLQHRARQFCAVMCRFMNWSEVP